MLANAPGARYARTTAPTAKHGSISLTSMRVRAPIAGTRTVSQASATDRSQRLCLALAFWNGRDPFLKERIFGLSGPEGNHGEDAKEYWWYNDATPTASWLRWRYYYPQAEFPYALLRQENARRSKDEPEFELVDTGIFEAYRYWQITADYAKAAPDDVCMRIELRNAGPDPAELHVLPTLWFRNRWSWDAGIKRPVIRVTADDGSGAVGVVPVANLIRLVNGSESGEATAR